MWHHVQLSEQIHPWDTVACCCDVKQPTNKLYSDNVSKSWFSAKEELCNAFAYKVGINVDLAAFWQSSRIQANVYIVKDRQPNTQPAKQTKIVLKDWFECTLVILLFKIMAKQGKVFGTKYEYLCCHTLPRDWLTTHISIQETGWLLTKPSCKFLHRISFFVVTHLIFMKTRLWLLHSMLLCTLTFVLETNAWQIELRSELLKNTAAQSQCTMEK